MPTSRSLLPVFGMWIVWVYLLSLVALRPLSDISPAPLRPSVRFVDADEIYKVDPDADPNGLQGVAAELSEPFNRVIEIPVTAIPVASTSEGVTQAEPGRDYTIDRDAVFVFPAYETRGYLRERDTFRDVTVTLDPGALEPRRFRLQLDGTEQVVIAADPQAFRTIQIPAAKKEPPSKGNPVHFRESLVDVDEKDLIDFKFFLDAKRPPEKDAELRFSLYKVMGPGEAAVLHFSKEFPAGMGETSFSLSDLVSREDLKRIGAAYDPSPGIDEWYELHVDARPPLISAGDPCLTTIFCRDRDEPAALKFYVEDQAGKPFKRILPGTDFWVTAELSRPIEVECPVTPVINGKKFKPGGVIPAGQQRSDRMGPFRLPADDKDTERDMLVSVDAQPGDGLGQCRSCNGNAGGCPECRKKCSRCGGPPGSCPTCEAECKQCGGRPGGCESCHGICKNCGGAPRGCKECKLLCGKCGDRKGGCAACGNGSGICSNCKGKPGGCGVCGGGGGGSGGGGPVSPPPGESLPVGPPVPGDFMIFLVNNQRLHEPGDIITKQVREAIKDRNPYDKGVIVINGDGKESLLTEKSDPPAADRSFETFSKDKQDLESQAAQVVEAIVRKRKNAEKSDIRTLVIWPERDFVSASSLEVFQALANDGRGPVSFLCPDADPERARELANGLVPGDGAKTEVTVRSPKSGELVDHMNDVLDTIGAAPEDELIPEETKK